jgi:hypothetical protein
MYEIQTAIFGTGSAEDKTTWNILDMLYLKLYFNMFISLFSILTYCQVQNLDFVTDETELG